MMLRSRPHAQSGECVDGSAPLLPWIVPPRAAAGGGCAAAWKNAGTETTSANTAAPANMWLRICIPPDASSRHILTVDQRRERGERRDVPRVMDVTLRAARESG